MSIHTYQSYVRAAKLGAMSATDFETWEALIHMSKRELVEIAMRLGGLCTDDCDNVDLALARVIEERDALKQAKII